ncbi:MAG: hypothetical protein EPO68_18495 [Planctomycetota bacterium]|nr:MAG: hypothetical protein EPO68_18495 [Planctomycetota bacterium]
MTSTRDLARTPQLAARLAALRRALLVAAWTRGLALVAACAAAWVAWAFLADWGLRVPTWVRAFHAVALVAGLAFALWRWLVLPLRRQPDERALALLLERAHGGRDELLVTAVELQRAPGAHDPELAPRILAQADDAARALDTRAALSWRPTLGALGLALAALGAWGLFAAVEPGLVAQFARRGVGADLPWPARTRIELELSSADANARFERSADVLHARVPRGARIDLAARIDGVDPGSVELVASDGTRRALARAGPQLYRTSLLGLSQLATAGGGRAPHFEGWVVGGDDQDERPRIVIDVEEPPDVASLALSIQPPAYTRAAARIEPSGSARVPSGARVTVHVRVHGDVVRATLRDEDGGTEHALARAPFPAAAAAPTAGAAGAGAAADPAAASTAAAPTAAASSPAGDASAAPVDAWACELALTHGLRYRILLADARGLVNPAPGLNSIEVLADRPPRVDWLGPEGGELAVTANGALRIRAQVSDDWYVAGLGYELTRRPSAPGTAPSARIALPLGAPGAALANSVPAAEGAPGQLLPRAFSSALLEVAQLMPDAPIATQHDLVLVASDATEPLAQEGRSSSLRIVLVRAEELLRAVQGDLARPRMHAEALAKRMLERAARYDELLTAHGGDDAWESADLQAAHALLAGVLRSRGDSSTLFRELAGLAERVVYARVDEASAPLCARLDDAQAAYASAGPSRDAWRGLCAQRRQSGLGDGGAAALLVDLVGLALELEQPHLERAEAALRAALAAPTAENLHAGLTEAAAAEAAARALLERMQDGIAEWDNYQAVIGLTRDILERQQALRDRTRSESNRR